MFNRLKIGVDIGTQNVKVVLFKNDIISDYVIKPIPKGYRMNEVEYDRIVSEILRDIFQNFKKSRDIYLTINDERLITRIIRVPKMSVNDIKNYLDLELQQYIPMPLDNYSVDFKILEECKDDNGIFYSLLVVAVANAIVEKYTQLIENLNCNLKAIDVHTNCILKMLKKYAFVSDKNIVRAFVDMGARYTNVSIIKNERLLINRLFSYGGYDITQVIANIYNIDFEEAENIKIKHLNLFEQTDKREELKDSVESTLNNFFMDLNRLFEYCSANLSSPINEIYLYGGTALINGITDVYFKWFKIPTKVMDYNVFNGLLSMEENKNIPFLLNAIGVVVREE